eukprot:contig_29120_g7159
MVLSAAGAGCLRQAACGFLGALAVQLDADVASLPSLPPPARVAPADVAGRVMRACAAGKRASARASTVLAAVIDAVTAAADADGVGDGVAESNSVRDGKRPAERRRAARQHTVDSLTSAASAFCERTHEVVAAELRTSVGDATPFVALYDDTPPPAPVGADARSLAAAAAASARGEPDGAWVRVEVQPAAVLGRLLFHVRAAAASMDVEDGVSAASGGVGASSVANTGVRRWRLGRGRALRAAAADVGVTFVARLHTAHSAALTASVRSDLWVERVVPPPVQHAVDRLDADSAAALAAAEAVSRGAKDTMRSSGGGREDGAAPSDEANGEGTNGASEVDHPLSGIEQGGRAGDAVGGGEAAGAPTSAAAAAAAAAVRGAHGGGATEVELAAARTDGSAMVLAAERFKVVSSSIRLARSLYVYAAIGGRLASPAHQGIGSILSSGGSATELARRAADLVRQYNALCSRAVLGAAALQWGGLRSITARHLALASRSVSFAVALSPRIAAVLVASTAAVADGGGSDSGGGSGVGAGSTGGAGGVSSSTLAAARAVVASLYGRVDVDLKSHHAQLLEKVVAIMLDRLDVHAATLAGLPWRRREDLCAIPVPSPYVGALAKEVSVLHRILASVLPPAEVRALFGVIGGAIGDRLTTEYEALDAGKSWVASRVAADVRLLADRLGDLSAFADDPRPGAMGAEGSADSPRRAPMDALRRQFVEPWEAEEAAAAARAEADRAAAVEAARIEAALAAAEVEAKAVAAAKQAEQEAAAAAVRAKEEEAAAAVRAEEEKAAAAARAEEEDKEAAAAAARAEEEAAAAAVRAEEEAAAAAVRAEEEQQEAAATAARAEAQKTAAAAAARAEEEQKQVAAAAARANVEAAAAAAQAQEEAAAAAVRAEREAAAAARVDEEAAAAAAHAEEVEKEAAVAATRAEEANTAAAEAARAEKERGARSAAAVEAERASAVTADAEATAAAAAEAEAHAAADAEADAQAPADAAAEAQAAANAKAQASADAEAQGAADAQAQAASVAEAEAQATADAAAAATPTATAAA